MTEVTTKRSKAGWTTVAFGDVVRQVKDKVDPDESGLDRYVAGEHMDTDDLRIRRWGEIGDGYLGPAFHMRFRRGHVLYGSRRTYLRKVAVADFEGIAANTTYVLAPRDPNVLLPELLPFVMQTEAFNQHSVRESKGSVNPYVNFSDLAWYEFALPPIEEQRRIAQMLVATTDAVDKHHSLLGAVETCHRALCRQIFSVGPDRRPPREEDLMAGWRLERLDAVSEFLDGKRVPLRSSDRSKRPGPYPYYGASGIIDHIDDFIFDEPLVLLSEDGANLVDRTTPIAFEATGRYWVNNHAHVLRIKPPLTNYYVIEYIESLSLTELISGTAQPKVNKAACEGLRVPVPCNRTVGEVVGLINRSRDAVVQVRDRLQGISALRRQIVESVLGPHGVDE